jgi:hypothetical protein
VALNAVIEEFVAVIKDVLLKNKNKKLQKVTE